MDAADETDPGRPRSMASDDGIADALLGAGRRAAALAARRAARAEHDLGVATWGVADELGELAATGACIDLVAAPGRHRWHGHLASVGEQLAVLVGPAGRDWWAIDPATVVGVAVASAEPTSVPPRPVLLDAWASTLDDALEVLADERALVVVCSASGRARGRLVQVGGALVAIDAGPSGGDRVAIRRTSIVAVGVEPPRGGR